MNAEVRTATIAWCISPILLILLCVVSLWLDDLSILTSAIAFLFVAIYTLVTFRFFNALYCSPRVKQLPWVRLAMILAVIVPVAYFTLRQFAPIRILYSESSRSIFDKVWDSADQIAFGYPTPFLRYFDVVDQAHGAMIVDWTSLLMTCWITLFFVFLPLVCIAFLLKLKDKTGEQVAAGQPAISTSIS